jgi:hypothetical protein
VNSANHRFGKCTMMEVRKRERFPLPRASVRSRFGQGTFAGPQGDGRDAPKAAICTRGVELAGSTPKLPFSGRETSAIRDEKHLEASDRTYNL